jgi:hypothetical protein
LILIKVPFGMLRFKRSVAKAAGQFGWPSF